MKKVFLVHVPKTAGTSLIRLFERTYGCVNCASFIDGLSQAARDGLEGKPFLAGHLFVAEAAELAYIDAYAKIVFFRDPYEQIVSVFRWLDHYSLPGNEQAAEAFPDAVRRLIGDVAATDFASPSSLAQFLDQLSERGVEAFDNPQARYLVCSRKTDVGYFHYQRPLSLDALDLFEAKLSWFDVVGITQRFDDAVMRLNEICDLNLPINSPPENVSPSPRMIDLGNAQIRQVLGRRISVDIQAYDRVVSRFWAN
jgi:hypothetical protein